MASAVVVALLSCGCGGTSARSALPANAVQIEGRLHDDPEMGLVLTADDGRRFVVAESFVAEELYSLRQMAIVVWAVDADAEGAGLAGIEVLRYTLAALPSGEIPVIGTLSEYIGRETSAALLLTDEDGATYRLLGDAVEELSRMTGSKVWVAGRMPRSIDPDPNEIVVTAYGVIRARGNFVDGFIEGE